MDKRLYKIYCCFYACSSEQVVVSEHVGEIRIDKGHPRIYFERLKHSCIGFECFNKIMFSTRTAADQQAKLLNDKKISGLEWEKCVREMQNRSNWVTLEQAKDIEITLEWYKENK